VSETGTAAAANNRIQANGGTADAQAVAKSQGTGSQATTEASASGQVVSSVQSWLNEYTSATAAKQAQMAATLGLSVDQLASLSVSQVQGKL